MLVLYPTNGNLELLASDWRQQQAVDPAPARLYPRGGAQPSVGLIGAIPIHKGRTRTEAFGGNDPPTSLDTCSWPIWQGQRCTKRPSSRKATPSAMFGPKHVRSENAVAHARGAERRGDPERPKLDRAEHPGCVPEAADGKMHTDRSNRAGVLAGYEGMAYLVLSMSTSLMDAGALLRWIEL